MEARRGFDAWHPVTHVYRLTRDNCCGPATERSVLASDYGVFEPEGRLVELLDRYYRRHGSTNRVRSDGTSPLALADQYKRIIKRKTGEEVRVFCSRQGNLETLDYLVFEHQMTPTLHRFVPSTKKGVRRFSGHYFLFGGLSGNVVNYFDVNGDGGWRSLHRIPFLDLWMRKTGERWYLVVLPERFTETSLLGPGRFL